MQLTPLQMQQQKIEHFKRDVLKSVEDRTLDEDIIQKHLQNTLKGDKVELYCDSRFLRKQNHSGAMYISGSKGEHDFIFPTRFLRGMRRKNMAQLKRRFKLKKFANCFDYVTHELKHALFQNANEKKIDILQKRMLSYVPKHREDEVMDLSCDIVSKCVSGGYKSSEEIRKDFRQATADFAPNYPKGFGKLFGLHVLLGIKDEQQAYMAGSKAKLEFLGEKARYSSVKYTFEELKDHMEIVRHRAQKAFFDEFVPLTRRFR